MLGVDDYTFHWADFLALRRGKVADALGALGGVDLVNLAAFVDRRVRALGLANIAVDAAVEYF